MAAIAGGDWDENMEARLVESLDTFWSRFTTQLSSCESRH